jgi:GH24 family phage-related lysozyme (muramidase)
MDPEVVRQLTEAVENLTDVMYNAGGKLSGLGDAATKATASQKSYDRGIVAGTELANSYAEAQKKSKQAAKNISDAKDEATSALKSFALGLTNTSTEFSKYNKTLESAGDAVLSLAKNLGPLGLAAGALFKGITMAATAATKQADNALKATDEFNKMGAAGGHTAKSIAEMGIRIGLSNEQFGLMPKALKRAGDSIVSLGASTADGQKKLMGMLAVTNEQREAFQRLGIGQEELMERQSDYVALQRASGMQLVGNMKSEASLQRASLEYTKNLLVLADITGQDVDSVAAQQKAAQSAYEIQLDNFRIAREIKKAELDTSEEGKKRVEQLKAEKKSRDDTLAIVSSIGDQDLTAGLQKFFATGAITEQSAMYAQMGIDMQGFRKRMQEGEDISGEFANALRDAVVKKNEEIGTAAAFNKETGKAFGQTEKILSFVAANAETDFKTKKKNAEASTGTPEDKTGKTGKTSAEDPAQIARNALTTTTIEANRLLEKTLLAGSPLMNGLNLLTGTVAALTTAAGLAVVALSALAAKGQLGKTLGTSTMPDSGGGRGAPGKGGAMKRIGGGLLKGGVAALGGAALSAGGEYAKEKGMEKTGAGLDIAGTTASYAGTGAMIGSIVPGVGTAVGAGVGAAIGFGKGLYDNYGTLTSGGGTDGSGLDASSKATGTSTADLKVMPPPKVKVSNQGMSEEEIKQMIIAHEGKRYRPYQDTLGLWTVGVGHLIGDGKSLPPSMNREFSEEEIMAMFEKDYAHHRSAAMNIPGFDKLDGRGQGALTDLTFNMGPSWISKWPKLKKQLGEGDTQSAAKNLEQSKWYGQVGNRAPTIVSLLRDSSTVSANLEGIAQGPESGYNATLHGNELIKRLTKDSILDKLANTPAGDMFSSNATPVDNSEMIDLMKEFVAKMDNLIDAQSDSNSIQTELLQYSKA